MRKLVGAILAFEGGLDIQVAGDRIIKISVKEPLKVMDLISTLEAVLSICPKEKEEDYKDLSEALLQGTLSVGQHGEAVVQQEPEPQPEPEPPEEESEEDQAWDQTYQAAREVGAGCQAGWPVNAQACARCLGCGGLTGSEIYYLMNGRKISTIRSFRDRLSLAARSSLNDPDTSFSGVSLREAKWFIEAWPFREAPEAIEPAGYFPIDLSADKAIVRQAAVANGTDELECVRAFIGDNPI